MTLYNIMSVYNDYMDIIEDDAVVARFDYKNSIPIEYNNREVWKIEVIGTKLLVYIK